MNKTSQTVVTEIGGSQKLDTKGKLTSYCGTAWSARSSGCFWV